MLDESQLNLGPVEKKIRESDIEAAVCRYAQNHYGMMAEKFTSPAKRSVPDRLFTMPGGRMFFIEFKAPGKKPTKKQAADHAKRRAMGAQVFVVDGIAEGKTIIDSMYYGLG